ncbi:MAG: hypothetical protein WA705_02005 [Candidatus Ozemobacteraceae bacterium]
MQFFKRSLCGMLLLAVLAGVVVTAGCGSDGGDGLAPLGAGSLVLVISADAPPTAGAFVASSRENPRPAIHAATASKKYVARVSKVTVDSYEVIASTTAYTVSADGRTLTFDQTTLTPPTNGQVKVEIFNAKDGVPIGSVPMFKSYVVKPVSNGQTDTANAALDASSTAKAIFYEKWPSNDTYTFTKFEEQVTSVAAWVSNWSALSVKVSNQIVGQIASPAAAFTWSVDSIENDAAIFALTIPAPIVTKTTTVNPEVEAPYLVWWNRSMDRRSPLSSADAAAFADVFDDSYLSGGHNKAQIVAELTTASTIGTTSWWYSKSSGNVTLQKIDESTYVAGYKGSVTHIGYDYYGSSYADTFPIDSSIDSFQLTGALDQSAFAKKALSNSFGANQIVKKGSDGKWRLAGHREKVEGAIVAFSTLKLKNGSPTTGLYLHLDAYTSSTIRLTSVSVSGGIIAGSVQLKKTEGGETSDGCWAYPSSSTNDLYLIPGGVTPKVGDQYVFIATFADGSTQTYTFNQLGTLPSPFEPPTVSASVVGNHIQATWTTSGNLWQANVSIFDNGSDTLIFGKSIPPTQTTFDIPLQGTTSTGKPYTLVSGKSVGIAVYLLGANQEWDAYNSFSYTIPGLSASQILPSQQSAEPLPQNISHYRRLQSILPPQPLL